MPLVKAQCTNCGGNLEVDSSKDAVVCPFCNTPFVVEKAVNLYKTETVNNIYANGSPVNVGMLDADTMFENWLITRIPKLEIDFHMYYAADPRNEFLSALKKLSIKKMDVDFAWKKGYGAVEKKEALLEEFEKMISETEALAEKFLTGPRFSKYITEVQGINEAKELLKECKEKKEELRKQQKEAQEEAARKAEIEANARRSGGIMLFILAIIFLILVYVFSNL